MKTLSVREQLLEHTLVLMRRRGVNGFSYRDLAELVGVKTSSIHYYFPSKDDLVLEAVTAYSATGAERIRAIDPRLPAREQARQYLVPFLDAHGRDEICLAAMLSAEVLSLPESVRRILQDYYRFNEGWLARLLERAEAQRGTASPVPPARLAPVLYGALQNGLVSARLFGAPDQLNAAANTLLDALPA